MTEMTNQETKASYFKKWYILDEKQSPQIYQGQWLTVASWLIWTGFTWPGG